MLSKYKRTISENHTTPHKSVEASSLEFVVVGVLRHLACYRSVRSAPLPNFATGECWCSIRKSISCIDVTGDVVRGIIRIILGRTSFVKSFLMFHAWDFFATIVVV